MNDRRLGAFWGPLVLVSLAACAANPPPQAGTGGPAVASTPPAEEQPASSAPPPSAEAEGAKAEGAPPPPPAEVPPIDSLPMLEGTPTAPDRFGLETHDEIVALTDSNAASKACTEKLVAAQWRQDTLHQFESKAHFDNCDFDAAVTYVRELDGLAEVAARDKDWDEVLLNLGQALHALQDFYAHSNYVELMAQQHAPEGIPSLKLWEPTASLSTLVAQGLVSGRVWWGFPKRCADSVPTHGDMAKDSPDGGHGAKPIPNSRLTHHEVAKRLAARTSRAYLKAAFQRWPGLAAHCGEGVGFLVGSDRRTVN